jgi:hypothetical protein
VLSVSSCVSRARQGALVTGWYGLQESMKAECNGKKVCTVSDYAVFS